MILYNSFMDGGTLHNSHLTSSTDAVNSDASLHFFERSQNKNIDKTINKMDWLTKRHPTVHAAITS